MTLDDLKEKIKEIPISTIIGHYALRKMTLGR